MEINEAKIHIDNPWIVNHDFKPNTTNRNIRPKPLYGGSIYTNMDPDPDQDQENGFHSNLKVPRIGSKLSLKATII